MVTRIIVPFEGYAGRYVWHCHILEHEDNEMMRPYEVLPSSHSESIGSKKIGSQIDRHAPDFLLFRCSLITLS